MNLLSQMLEKQVISKCNCQIVGKIKNVYFDKDFKKIVYFLLENCPAEFLGCDCALLPFDEVKNVNDAIVIFDCVPLISKNDVNQNDFLQNVIGKNVYLQNGTFKGEIVDVEFSKYGKVSKLVTSQASISPINVWQIGDVVMLKGETSKAPKRKMPRPKDETTVTLLVKDNQVNSVNENSKIITPDNNEVLQIGVEVTPQLPIAFSQDNKEPLISENALLQLAGSDVLLTDDEHTPTRIICEYDFLLGRTLSQDVNSYLGEKIATRGDVVDDALVERCRRAGKLVELTLNSHRQN